MSTVERLHVHGDRWEHVADMNKVTLSKKLERDVAFDVSFIS